MKQVWMKRFAAWLLAALMLVSPALAEIQEAAVVSTEIVEEAVAEAAMFDLPEEEAEEASEDETEEASEGETEEDSEGESKGAPTSEDGEEPVDGAEAGDGEDPGEDGEDTAAKAAREGAGAAADESADEAEDEDEREARREGADADEPSDETGDEPTDEANDALTDEAESEASDETGEEAGAASGDASEGEAGEGEADDGDEPADPESDEASSEGDAVKDGAANAEADAASEVPTAETTGVPAAEAQAAPTATPEVVEAEETPAPKLEEADEEAESAPILPAEVLMGKGEKRLLTPAIAADEPVEISWTSSKPRTVAVSQKGKLNAKRRGSAIITMTASNGETASCLVRVYKAPSKVTMVPGKKLSMGLGETRQLSGKLPSGTYSALSWSSTAPGIVAVDAEGRVTALSPGTAKIKVKTFNGKKAVCKISVKAAPTAVAFSVGDQTLGVGVTVDLKPIVDPGAAANVVLSSDDPGVAAINGSKVTGVSPGSAVITGTTYNGLTTSLTVTVLPAPTAVGLAYATLYMGVGEKVKLEPATDPGTATTYKFKSGNKKIATVSAAGTVKGKKTGSTTITVTTHNGLKVKLKVKVRKAPSKVTLKPKSLAMEVGDTYQLSVSLPKKTASTITFTSSNPDVVSVDNAGMLHAEQPGTAAITAQTYNKKTATCQVTVASFSDAASASSGSLSLNTTGMVMMRLGASWNLTATSNGGSLDGIKWTTTAASIARVSADGGNCTVTAAGAGTAIVTAKLPDDSYASVIFMMVDVNDLSASNFNAVQKALLNHEGLIDSDAGGNVIWDMIAGQMLKSKYTQSKVDDLIARLKAADPSYRDLYIYSFGTYSQLAEQVVSASYFDQDTNKLYLKSSSLYSDTNYAYVVFHESGHAIDWNADGNNALNSMNSQATSAVLSDVRNLLSDRVAAAINSTGVSSTAVDTGKVVDMLMNYRVLTDTSLLNELNESERKVYAQLSNAMSGEMNKQLPTNNGCMVWDAVEGATNYAVHGGFGHYYLLSGDYKAEATYYFWDLKGEPHITTEPWAEFFSANIMGDSNTLKLNWSYLPQTCKYFAETLVPQMLGYFTDRVKSA